MEDPKDFKERALRRVKEGLGRLCRRRSVTITEYDPSFKVLYLGNVLTGWAKGEGCVEKPLLTLWNNYQGSAKPDVQMKMTITQSGLKAVTKEHGLTEYWSHRVTYCSAPAAYPRVFCWVYRHEGRRLKQELRCHAVLCSKEGTAKQMAQDLSFRLAQALIEFKRDKISKQNARLSLANAVYDNPSLPRRKILLSTGSQNYRPPLERSKSAPKLMSIEESVEEEEADYVNCGSAAGGPGGSGASNSRRRGFFRRSDTIGEIQVSANAGPRLRGFLRRANTVDEMGTDERDRLAEDPILESAELRVRHQESTRPGDSPVQAFNHYLSYPGILEEDPFAVGIHVPGDFDSPPVSLQEKVEHNPRVSRMSWTAGDKEHKFLLESLLPEQNAAVLETSFTKVYPTDVRIDYMDQESTPSLQSISSGSESQRGGQRGFDMDSLSEEGDSDESGFVETTTADDKIRDLPSHQLVKPRLDPSKSASLQV
ncbi:hypothetical protein GE061_001846 [Apolygus lucorum]|uniref:Uncharacterized protein n=1 Tax=Apolygus lucorum TaxID=248454 RepID=A0A6A4J5F0_APOLU|nr:hypothetical protein GE061_001846 [Apolygus lucorum]